MSGTLLNLVRLCLPGTERNPYTNRCNKKCEKSHTRIKQDTLKRFSCHKKCKPHESRNRQTLRCRKNRSPKRTPQKRGRKPKHRMSRKSNSRSPLVTLDRVYYRNRSNSLSNNTPLRSRTPTVSFGKLYDMREDIWEENPRK